MKEWQRWSRIVVAGGVLGLGGGPALVQAAVPSYQGAPVVVAYSTDAKALGYPDSRKLVRDGNGTLSLAFRHRQHIFVAQAPGGAWQPPSQVDTLAGYMQRVPAITLDSANNAHLAWYGLDPVFNSPDDYRQIKYSRSYAYGGWSGATDTAAGNYNIYPIYDSNHCLSSSQPYWQEHPVAHIGRGRIGGVSYSDVLYVAWESRDGSKGNCVEGKVRLWRQALSNSQTSLVVKLPDAGLTGGNFSRPTVVASYDGQVVYVLASAANSGAKQIVWTRSIDGGVTWSSWSYVQKTGIDQRHVSVAVDSGNRLHLCWRELKSGSTRYSQIRYAVYDGSGWSTKTLTSGDAFRTHPSLTVFRAGTTEEVAVAWLETGSAPSDEAETRGNVWLSVRSSTSANQATGTWTTPIRLNAPSGSGLSTGRAAYPSLRWSRYGGQDDLDVVWEDGVGSSSGNLVCPSNGCPLYYARLQHRP